MAAVEGGAPRFQIILESRKGLDHMEVLVGMDPVFFTDDVRDLVERRRNLEGRLSDELGVRVDVRFVEPSGMKGAEEGLPRVVDNRRK